MEEEEAEQKHFRNSSPFIVELRERLAKASQKLSKAKELSADCGCLIWFVVAQFIALC